MNAMKFSSIFFLILFFTHSLFAGVESDIQVEIKSALLQRIQTLKHNNPNAELTFFVDWDGTMIKGDITEGLHNGTIEDYMGLAELAFQKRLINIPNGEPTTFIEYLKKYEDLLKESHEKAYAWSSEYFANLDSHKQDELRALVKDHFQKQLGSRVFATSAAIVEYLHQLGVEIYVVSASPLAFVEGTLEVFPWLKRSHISGIDRQRNGNQIRDPIINFAHGKIDRIQSVLKEYQQPEIVGGMGNSWGTDGAFLQEIGRLGGVSVIFNAGEAMAQFNKFPIKQFGISEILGSRFVHSSLFRCLDSLANP